MKYYVGVDIGSTSIKVALIDNDLKMISSKTAPTGCHFHQNTIDALSSMLAFAELGRSDVAYITATGYGRKLFKDADETITEITANAAGARHIGKSMAISTRS